MARTHTLFTVDVMMGVRKKYAVMSLIIDGLSLTTRTYCACLTITLMLRHVGVSNQLNTYSNIYIYI
jgi:hypothetical protein